MSDKVKRSEEEWRRLLTPHEYFITREKGTERAYTGEYWDTMVEGQYDCICCGQELFDSTTKFVSHCGWPAFIPQRETLRSPEAPDQLRHGPYRGAVQSLRRPPRTRVRGRPTSRACATASTLQPSSFERRRPSAARSASEPTVGRARRGTSHCPEPSSRVRRRPGPAERECQRQTARHPCHPRQAPQRTRGAGHAPTGSRRSAPPLSRRGCPETLEQTLRDHRVAPTRSPGRHRAGPTQGQRRR